MESRIFVGGIALLTIISVGFSKDATGLAHCGGGGRSPSTGASLNSAGLGSSRLKPSRSTNCSTTDSSASSSSTDSSGTTKSSRLRSARCRRRRNRRVHRLFRSATKSTSSAIGANLASSTTSGSKLICTGKLTTSTGTSCIAESKLITSSELAVGVASKLTTEPLTASKTLSATDTAESALTSSSKLVALSSTELTAKPTLHTTKLVALGAVELATKSILALGTAKALICASESSTALSAELVAKSALGPALGSSLRVAKLFIVVSRCRLALDHERLLKREKRDESEHHRSLHGRCLVSGG